jgi:uncharacterized protein (TIGR02147 family)
VLVEGRKKTGAGKLSVPAPVNTDCAPGLLAHHPAAVEVTNLVRGKARLSGLVFVALLFRPADGDPASGAAAIELLTRRAHLADEVIVGLGRRGGLVGVSKGRNREKRKSHQKRFHVFSLGLEVGLRAFKSALLEKREQGEIQILKTIWFQNFETRTRLGFVDPRAILKAELEKRCARNPRYSLRAFARALGVSHTVLSLVLSGKRPMPPKSGQKMAESLGLGPDERERFLSRETAKAETGSAQSQRLELDKFEVIADWHHYAILSLLEIRGARFEAAWISSRLGISEMQAQLAMERLCRLELVHKVRGKWKQSGLPLRVENTVSTPATRRCHRGLLEKALESLENDPMEARDFSAITFAMNAKNVTYALKRIRDFRRQLSEELERMGAPTEVYELAVQLFPVSRKKGK